jgi:hypothetical protein
MSFMMHVVAGFGLCVVFAPPLVAGGADFNMTAWHVIFQDMSTSKAEGGAGNQATRGDSLSEWPWRWKL